MLSVTLVKLLKVLHLMVLRHSGDVTNVVMLTI